jgi:hypothetical protein
LIEQWEERIAQHSALKLNEDIFVTSYQTAIKKMSDRQWNLVIFDEVHHIGAKYFIKLSWLKRKYGLSLSATPYREDQGGEELIFGLTGEPTGLSWSHFRDLKIIKNPVCNVWIERNLDSKLRRLATLLSEPKKTIIFSDSIELGKSVAARYKIPHIFGQSINRLKTLADSETSVISRVGDEGVSLPDIERVIEISWLFGSRRQELQRFTRLLHGQKVEGEGHVLMTVEEYMRDKKRLFSILDRGFKIVLHREGVDEKTIHKITERTYERPRIAQSRTVPERTRQESGSVMIPEALRARLPYIDKTISKLPSELTRKCTVVMLANPTTIYTIEDLAVATGYEPSNIRLHLRFKQLIQQRLIKKISVGKYQAAA